MNKKLINLSVFFLLTCVFIYTKNSTEHISKSSIKTYFDHLNGYDIIQHVEMKKNIIEKLELDDYLYTDYRGPHGKITLYVGYYYTADKASAAHSPLICYPGQGWKIDSQLPNSTVDVGPLSINYYEIVTSLGKRKELVLYWFQASHDTNTEAFKNKTNVAYNKITNNGEQHAFVRVSLPLEATGSKQVKQDALDFIRIFYPYFIQFIDEG